MPPGITPCIWLVAGVALGVAAAAAWRLLNRRPQPKQPASPTEPEPEPPRERPPTIQRIIASKTGDSVPVGVGSLVSDTTLRALHEGKELYELAYDALEEIVAEASARSLDELDDDVLRHKIVECVSSKHIKTLLPAHANALWGCVLSWDPFPERLEKQSLDLDAIPGELKSRYAGQMDFGKAGAIVKAKLG